MNKSVDPDQLAFSEDLHSVFSKDFEKRDAECTYQVKFGNHSKVIEIKSNDYLLQR